MRLGSAIAELVAPTRCAGCEFPGTLLCDPCESALPRIDRTRACEACGAPWGALVCTECWDMEFAFSSALAVGVLDGALARAVVLYKDAGERRLAAVLGGLLASQLSEHWAGWADVVTWIPATKEAVTRRGFDHANGLARVVASETATPLQRLLQRSRARDQRVLGRLERAVNAEGTFRVISSVPERVLVVDDVLTTGSTLDAASGVLREHGASEVRVAVLARAW